MPKKDFSKAVKEKLRKKRLNVPKMASFLNIPETQLRNWMARNRFSQDAAKSICSYLKIDENDYNLTYIDPSK